MKYLFKSIILLILLSSLACKPSEDFSFASEGTNDGIGNSALSFDPVSLDFGNVAPSPAFSDQEVTVINSSDQVLNMGSARETSPSYEVVSDECDGTLLAANGRCTVTLRFSPVAGGTHNVDLNVFYGSESGEAESFFAGVNATGTSNADDPSNYQLTFVTGSTMTFSWTDNAINETSYEIERCDGAACDTIFTVAETVSLPANSTSHTFTGLTEGALHKVRIRAVSGVGNSGFLTGDMTLIFGGIQAVDNGTGQSVFLDQIDCSTNDGVYVGLTWNGIANAASYNIFEVNEGVQTFLASAPSGSTNFLVSNLTAETEKTYRVVAVTSAGVVSKNITNDQDLTTSNFSPCFVIGQTDATSMRLDNAGFNPYDVWTDGTSRLIVAETSNHRVLIWNSMPTSMAEPADIVLGQPDMEQNVCNNGGRSATSLCNPRGVFFDGTKLYVADLSNHRVLIWNTLPTTNGAPADVVVGQATMANATAGVTSIRMNQPWDVFVAGGKLMISDSNNHRVVILNSIPTTNEATFDVVVGQANKTSRVTSCNQSTLQTPRALWSDGTKLIVTSQPRHRALVWNTVPVADGTAADVVIGQNNFTTCSSNGGNGRNAFGFSNPWGVASDGTQLWIGDMSNHRVLYFSTIPTVAGVSADGFYGPPTFTSASGGASSQRFNAPGGMFVANNQLWITDVNNHRVIKKEPVPTSATGLEVHSLALLKDNFQTNDINRQAPMDGSIVTRPHQVATDGTMLAVADAFNHRVLIWNKMPTSNKQKPDVIIGQPDEFGFLPDNNANDRMLHHPEGVALHNSKLYIADSSNRRVLVWNTVPTTGNVGADFVLGQNAFNTFGAGTGANQMNFPAHIFFSDDNKMIVTDRDNNRILIWNTPPTVTGQPADVVVGQPSFGTNTAAVTQSRIDGPLSAITVGNKLVVAERDNFRVMVWNTIPTVNGAPADVVLGQPDFTTRVQNNGGTNDKSLDRPMGLATSGGKLFVSDYDDRRILIWNTVPTTNFEPANSVFGQPNFISVTDNNGGRDFDRLSLQTYITAGPQHLFISSERNQRVMAVPIPE